MPATAPTLTSGHQLEDAIECALEALKIADGEGTRADGSGVNPKTGWASDELCDAYVVVRGLPARVRELEARSRECPPVSLTGVLYIAASICLVWAAVLCFTVKLGGS